MWVGANGLIKIAKGTSGTLKVPGMTLKQFGTIDIKLTLDRKQLNTAFASWAGDGFNFFAKGTMNQWTPVQLLDNGQNGDEAAGDGILTYVQSVAKGKHDGLLNAGDEVQFIFVATQGDDLPENGQEYKAATQAYQDGVGAATATGLAGAWVSAQVILSKDSKGKFLNTAVVVPAASAASCDPPCNADQVCTAGQCVAKTVDCTPACGDGQVCQAGQCVPTPCNPACAADESCKAGQCVKNQLPLAITAVDPAKGWTSGGDQVVLTGTGFVNGTTVIFGDKAATAAKVSADGLQVICTTPAHDAGLVDVVAKNPDATTATLSGGFYFQVMPKPSVQLPQMQLGGNNKDGVTVSVLAQVQSVSELPGATPGLQVDVAYGPVGSDPVKNPAAWTFVPASFTSEDVQKGQETWSATLPVLAIGTYAVVARATWQGQTVYGDADGSDNGLQANQFTTLTIVDKATQPTLTAVQPAWVPAKGGAVQLLGANLLGSFGVHFVSQFQGKTFDATTVVANGTGLLATTPGLPPLPADVVVTPPVGAAMTLKNALDVEPFDTPVIDGAVGQAADWNPWSLASVQATPTGWGVGKNQLDQLYAAWDKDSLYFGIVGTVEASNAVVIYLDIDYGSGTGAKQPSDLKDNTGNLDDAIANGLLVADGQIGIDFAAGSLGMAGFTGTNLALSTDAGWRGLSNVNDFAWTVGTVAPAVDKQSLEFSILLTQLFPKGLPAGGATVKYVAVIVNKDGSSISNQFLPPQQAANATTVDTWGTLHIYPVP